MRVRTWEIIGVGVLGTLAGSVLKMGNGPGSGLLGLYNGMTI